MIHNLFKNEVQLEPISHKYYDSAGNRYVGFSELYSKLVAKFNADFISKQIAKSSDQSADEIKQSWQAKTDSGTRIDKCLEMFAQTATILPEDEDLRGLVEEVLVKYKQFNKTYEQGVPYCMDYRVAGSWDKLSLVSNRKDSRFQLSDFKCFENGFESLFAIKGQAWLNAPFSHLPNNRYTKISFQLSFYARLFEKLTGRKCERLFIDLIVPKVENGKVVSFTNQVVPVMYLRNDIDILLEYFKDEIMDDLNNVVDAAYESSDDIF